MVNNAHQLDERIKAIYGGEMERKTLLEETTGFNSLGEFIDFVTQKISKTPKFFACVAVESTAGTEFTFFLPSRDDSEDSMIRTVSAITIATSATKVFLGYSASKFNDEDGAVLESQIAVFFASSPEGSHPFIFFDLLPSDSADGWDLVGTGKLDEPVPDGMIIGSDLHRYIIQNDGTYKVLARKSLEEWRPNLLWDWKRYDNRN